MKIQKVLTVFLSVLALHATAQQTPKCEGDFKKFESNSKAGDVKDEAGLLESLLKSCPKINEKLYVYGEAILVNRLKSANSAEDKKKRADDLVKLYTQYDKNFPGNTAGNAVKKALLLKEYKMASDEELFNQLDAAFTANSSSFDSYEAFEAYYNLYLARFEAGKNITQDQFIEKYGAIAGQVVAAKTAIATKKAQLLEKEQKESLTTEETRFVKVADKLVKNLDGVAGNINKQSAKYVNCEKLEGLYAKGYEAHSKDAPWLRMVTGVLMDNNCYNSALLQQTAMGAYELSPNTESAHILGSLAIRKRDFKQAGVYYDKAVLMENDAVKKSALLYEAAALLRNEDKAEAKKYALQAAAANPKSGKPYLFLSELYSSVSGSECDFTDFEKKALYWLAIDAANKAVAAEAKYRPTAEALIKRYDAAKPSKKDAKAAGKKKGDKITFGCWINETLTVPNLQ